MSDTATGMSTPIPNDDPRCHCTIGKDESAIQLTGGEPGATATVSIHADCPLHGEAARSIVRRTLGAVSIGPR